jgi:hypothetical protein
VSTQGCFTHKPVDNLLSGVTKAEIGKWYHVVVICTVNGERYLYVNGREDSEPAQLIKGYNNTGYDPIDELCFGSTISDEKTEGLGFMGALDEIAIWNKILSAEQIRLLYQSAEKK